MSTGFRAMVEAEEFARIMTNALAFFPARGAVKFGHLSFMPQSAVAIGTDTFTMGRDACEVESWNSTAGPMALPINVELDRDGWRELEAQLRKDRGNFGRLEYVPGDALTYYPGGDKAEVATAQDQTGKPWPMTVHDLEGEKFWAACNELLTRYDDRPTETPDVLTFDPALFGRFQKVKLSKKAEAEKVLDFYYQGQDAPMLAKVGPTFTGLIMPINRDRYLENQPEDAAENLWAGNCECQGGPHGGYTCRECR